MSLPATVALPMGAGDARLLEYAISAYLVGYARKTRENRAHDLRRWVSWCDEHDLDPLFDVRREHIQGYSTYLQEDVGHAATTVCGSLTSICGFYRSAHRDELIPRDPGAYVTHPKRPARSTANYLLAGELDQLITAAMAHRDPARGALVCLLGLQGLRLSEVLGIDIEHLGRLGTWRTAQITRAKRGGGDTVSLSPRTVAAVDRAQAGRASGPLLVGATGVRMMSDMARYRLHGLVRGIGVTRRITPHSLRYTHVTLARDAGVPDAHTQASTGHVDATMLAWYDRSRAGVERNSSHAVDAYVQSAA